MYVGHECFFLEMYEYLIYKLLLQVFGGFNRLGLSMSIDTTRRHIDNYKQDYDTKVINWKNAVSVGTYV